MYKYTMKRVGGNGVETAASVFSIIRPTIRSEKKIVPTNDKAVVWENEDSKSAIIDEWEVVWPKCLDALLRVLERKKNLSMGKLQDEEILLRFNEKTFVQNNQGMNERILFPSF